MYLSLTEHKKVKSQERFQWQEWVTSLRVIFYQDTIDLQTLMVTLPNFMLKPCYWRHNIVNHRPWKNHVVTYLEMPFSLPSSHCDRRCSTYYHREVIMSLTKLWTLTSTMRLA